MIMTVAGARADATFARRRRWRAYHIARMCANSYKFIQGEPNSDE